MLTLQLFRFIAAGANHVAVGELDNVFQPAFNCALGVYYSYDSYLNKDKPSHLPSGSAVIGTSDSALVSSRTKTVSSVFFQLQRVLLTTVCASSPLRVARANRRRHRSHSLRMAAARRRLFRFSRLPLSPWSWTQRTLAVTSLMGRAGELSQLLSRFLRLLWRRLKSERPARADRVFTILRRLQVLRRSLVHHRQLLPR